MTSFDVKCSVLTKQTQELGKLENRLIDIQQDVLSIRQSLSFKIKAREQIGADLGKAADMLEEQSGGMRSMKTTLDDAVALYTSTEERIISNAGGGAALETRLEEDYKNGQISSGTYDAISSLRSALLSMGIAFTRDAAMRALTEKVTQGLADAAVNWLRGSTYAFVDRGLVAQAVGGANIVWREAPNALKTAIRGAAKYGVPIIGTLIDYGLQVAGGESSGDAAVKAVSHTAIGIASAKAGAALGATIGSAFPVVGTAIVGAIGAAAGFVLGVAGNMFFDYVYDNKEIIINTVVDTVTTIADGIGNVMEGAGDAIQGFFSGLGAVFG